MGNKKISSNAFEGRIFKILTTTLIMIACKCDVEANAGGQISQTNMSPELRQAFDTPAQLDNQQGPAPYGQPQQLPYFGHQLPAQFGYQQQAAPYSQPQQSPEFGYQEPARLANQQQANLYQQPQQSPELGYQEPARLANQQQANLYQQPQQPPKFYYQPPAQPGACLKRGMMREIFSCSELNYIDTLRELIQALNTRQNVYDPINLVLSRIQFSDVEKPSQKLSMNWLSVGVFVRELALNILFVTGIENDAFNSPQFAYLEVLLILYTKIPSFSAEMFSGLANLKKLNIVNPNLETIEKSALAPLQNLEVFNLWHCGPHSFSLDNLFDTAMHQLKQVTILHCPLIKTINEATFSGLVNVQELVLVSNGIEHIGERSFDIVLKTLTMLSLVGNQLKTISPNFFRIERKGVVSIQLDGNPWHCDYELEDLRVFIQMTNTYRFNGIFCYKPEEYKGIQLSMCPDLSEIQVKEGFTVVAAAQLLGETPTIPQQSAVSESVGVCLNTKSNNYEILSCEKLDHVDMLHELSQALNMRMNRNDPISLNLTQIRFSKSGYLSPVLPMDWFPVKTSVEGLLLSDLDVTGIENDAFNSPQFANLELLSLHNTKIPTLSSGMFNGLEKLELLKIVRPNLESIEKSALAPLKNLEKFTINYCGEHLLSVDNLFDIAMYQLKEVEIAWCNLPNTINEATFSGLVNVQGINLRFNAIEHIGERSFDVILKTLKRLSLSDNRLKTISPDLFKTKHEGIVEIHLNRNPWHCDCKLQEMGTFIKNSETYNFGGMFCITPEEYKENLLVLCPDLCANEKKDEEKDEEEYEEEYEEEDDEIEEKTDEKDKDELAGNVFVAAAETPAALPKPNKPLEGAIPFELAQPTEPGEPAQPASAASNPTENGQGNKEPANAPTASNDAAAIHETLVFDCIVITYLTIYHIY